MLTLKKYWHTNWQTLERLANDLSISREEKTTKQELYQACLDTKEYKKYAKAKKKEKSTWEIAMATIAELHKAREAYEDTQEYYDYYEWLNEQDD